MKRWPFRPTAGDSDPCIRINANIVCDIVCDMMHKTYDIVGQNRRHHIRREYTTLYVRTYDVGQTYDIVYLLYRRTYDIVGPTISYITTS